MMVAYFGVTAARICSLVASKSVPRQVLISSARRSTAASKISLSP